MDVISVIRTKRDRGELSDEQIDWVIDAYTRGEVADEQMSALAMAILLNGMNRAEIARWTAAMIASGERMDFVAAVPPHHRQALHRRRRRQDHPAARPAGRRLRCRRAAAQRPRPRPHRRHPGQAGVHPRLARPPLQRGDAVRPGHDRRGDLRGGRRPRPGRQEAVRAARRHRHRRGDPADRQLDHVQEDRRGHRRARPGRQGRLRRLHEDASRTPANWPPPWSRWAPTTAYAPSRCSPTCRPRSACTAGNALEVRESVEVLAGGGPAGRRRADPRAGPRDAGRRRPARTPTRRRRWPTAPPWTSGAA